VMARKYADLTLSELADCLTLPVLLELWPMLLLKNVWMCITLELALLSAKKNHTVASNYRVQ
jgi:hypothetical protein